MRPRRDVYAALADPTRREILEALRDDGALNAGDIAARFQKVSRPGISRHLRVLRECGLVHMQSQGRQQIYALDPTPIAGVRDGWLSTFGKAHVAALKALRKRAEREVGR